MHGPGLDCRDGENDFRDKREKTADILEVRKREKGKIKNDT